MRLWLLLLLFSLFLASSTLPQASAQGVLGTWREPGGSVIAIESCGTEVCARLIVIRKNAPSTTDSHNPEAALRSRPLCGLVIGSGFHLSGPATAEGGHLYDPKSGKTYKGSMSSHGETLELRGYVGIKAFGRSETWQRTPAPPQGCR